MPFLNRVLLDREHEDLSHEVIAIDLNGLLNGTVADIPPAKDDHLYIPSVNDLKEEETVSIYGESSKSGNLPVFGQDDYRGFGCSGRRFA